MSAIPSRKSIRHRLIVCGMLLTVLTLTLFMVGVQAYEISGKRVELMGNMSVIAEVTGRNSAASILFGDKADAEGVLASLQASPDFLHGAIFMQDGSLLAEYRSPAAPAVPCHDLEPSSLESSSAGWNFKTCGVLLYHPITLHQRQLGTLAIVHSLNAMMSGIAFDLLFNILALLVSLALSHWLWKRFATHITKPLYHLYLLTQQVQTYRDFNLRAKVVSQDEVGELTVGFNRMMSQLERHDALLREELKHRREAEKRLNQLAFYDNVTMLHNRHFFKEHLEAVLVRADLNQTSCAVLFIDLDGFKKVNDTLGHETGDELLRLVADRLKVGVRDSDIVCRLGGDEFAIVVERDVIIERVEQLAGRLIEIMTPGYKLGRQIIHVTASIGACLYPEQATDKDMLVRHADIAMYQAKDNGKNGYCIYHPSYQQTNSLLPYSA